MKIGLYICLTGWVFLSPVNILAQQRNTVELPLTLTLPEVAVVDFHIANKPPVGTLGAGNNKMVEQVLTLHTGDTWINYSSVVADGATNLISACITGANLPAQVRIKVMISDDVGEGKGALGTAVEELILNAYPQNIITNIGSCYTGSGLERGHLLRFRWEDDQGNDLTDELDESLSVSITYTIASTK